MSRFAFLTFSVYLDIRSFVRAAKGRRRVEVEYERELPTQQETDW